MRFLMMTLSLAAALSSSSLRADETLTASVGLDQALQEAREHNPEMRKLQLAADAASWKRVESISAYIPHLDVKGNYLAGADYTRLNVVFGGEAIVFPEAFPQSEVDLEASWMIFDGFAALDSYHADSLEAEAAALDAKHAESHLEQAVRVRFYKALAAQELVKVADQNIATLEEHAQLADASEKAGFATKVDTLRIGSQLEEARAQKLLAVDNAALARQDLASAVGVSADARALDGKLPEPDASKVPADLALDTSQREDFVALQRREAALDSRQSAATAGLWAPKVALFGAEQYYQFGNFDPVILPSNGFQNAYLYGVRGSWNVFSGGGDQAKVQQAKDALAQSAEALRRLSLGSNDEFEAAKRHYIYNVALYQARLRSVEMCEESVRLATLGVQAGSQTHSQVLDADRDLFRARAGVIQAQVDAAEALATLEQALGRPL